MASKRGSDTSTSEKTSELMGLFQPPSPKSPAAVDEEKKVENGPGSVSHMMNLFATPGQSSLPLPKPLLERDSTAPRSNTSNSIIHNSEKTPLLLPENFASLFTEQTPKTSTTTSRNDGPCSTEILHPLLTRKLSTGPSMSPIRESGAKKSSGGNTFRRRCRRLIDSCVTEAAKPSTIIGSFMYLLYHIVFCLALGSAIIRPNNPTSILGLMTKTAALGSISASFVYWYMLGSEIPALYPTVDLFLAPFLAHLGLIVDKTLAGDDMVTKKENDTIFLTTFCLLSGIGICFSGCLLILASVFKLANLGSFLPFSVISGFFAAVGILTWTLSVTIDAGQPIGAIIMSGDMEVISYAIIHHVPSFLIAIVMKVLGPRNPFYVILVALCSIGSFYIGMFITGVSFEDCMEDGWFWSHSELVYRSTESPQIGFNSWSPPAPFGFINELFRGKVHWGAVRAGLSTSIAMGFLYLIRCSVHGTALKKNIPNLCRKARDSDEIISSPQLPTKPRPIKSRKFSEAVDIEQVVMQSAVVEEGSNDKPVRLIQAKPTNIQLKAILFPYGCSQFVSALFGGFAITPSVAASTTMFSLGADGLAPQFGALCLLLSFYLTDFQLVQYIPKPAFSSMLCLAFIDMIYTWFYKSFFKTKDKWEWMVVPLIVVSAFALDLLSAVFLGIAISTFIFVASFFRSGVVKYVANGSVIQSTIERPFRSSDFLNTNGDLIKVLVLQNYLFFGNANSVFHYIGIILNGDDTKAEDRARCPKFLILDLTLVTGMDTSTVDIFHDIKNLCISNKCKLFMTGISPNIRTILSLGGFKADTNPNKTKRNLRFFISLDSALGKAEDILLDSDFDEKEPFVSSSRRRLLSEGDHGFRMALRSIDEEHEESFALGLLDLQEYTSLVELKPGDSLYSNRDPAERGLFFIESGVLKVEHDTSATMTRGSLRRPGTVNSIPGDFNDSLTKIQARSLAQYSTLLNTDSPTFRLARIGPGWVAGTSEYISGTSHSGQHIAVTECRLHYISLLKLQEIEQENPSLVLSLYKLLSHLLARRQEATIGQLAILHSIMTSPARFHS